MQSSQRKTKQVADYMSRASKKTASSAGKMHPHKDAGTMQSFDEFRDKCKLIDDGLSEEYIESISTLKSAKIRPNRSRIQKRKSVSTIW